MTAELPYAFEARAEGQSAQIIQIDNGKAIAAAAIFAALCGICTAVSVGTVWHSKDRERETESRYQVLKNHVDDYRNELKLFCERVDDLKCKNLIKEHDDVHR